MNIYKTEASVLKDYDLGEQDKIIVFYSRRYGKIKVIAKGARRIKSKFAPLIQPPSYNSLLIYENRKGNLDVLSECVAKCQFLKIKKDFANKAKRNWIRCVLETGEVNRHYISNNSAENPPKEHEWTEVTEPTKFGQIEIYPSNSKENRGYAFRIPNIH